MKKKLTTKRSTTTNNMRSKAMTHPDGSILDLILQFSLKYWTTIRLSSKLMESQSLNHLWSLQYLKPLKWRRITTKSMSGNFWMYLLLLVRLVLYWQFLVLLFLPYNFLFNFLSPLLLLGQLISSSNVNKLAEL